MDYLRFKIMAVQNEEWSTMIAYLRMAAFTRDGLSQAPRHYASSQETFTQPLFHRA